MAEWKLTNQAIGTESQWKPTGKTYEQMPNKPQKEESMFPSVDELAKANIKADQLKQVIPSRTYEENLVAEKPQKQPPNLQMEVAKAKFKRGEQLSLEEKLAVDGYAAELAKNTGTPVRNTFEILSFMTGKGFENQSKNILPTLEEQKSTLASAALGGKGKEIISKSQQRQKEIDIDFLTPNEKQEYLKKQSAGYGDSYLKSKKADVDIRKGEAVANEYINGNFGTKLALALDVYLGVGANSAISGQVSALENISNLIAGRDTDYQTENSVNDYANYYLREYFDENDKKLEGIIQDIMVNVSNNLTAQSLGMLTGNRAIGLMPFALSVFGNAFEEAKQSNDSNSKAILYALANTASETSLELVLGYVPFAKGIFSDTIKNKVVSNVANLFARTLVRRGLDASGEFIEESLQEGINPFLKNIILGEDNPTLLNDTENQLKNMVYSGFVGAMSALVMGGAESVVNLRTEKAIQDYGKKMRETIEAVDGVNFSEIVSGTKEYGLTLDENETLHQAAKEFSNEKQTDFTVGKLLIAATQNTTEASAVVYQQIGQQIINSGSVSRYVSDYKTAVESGAVFSESVNTMAADIEAGNITPQTVGKFVLTLNNDAPLASVRGAMVRLVNKNKETTSQAETEQTTETTQETGETEITEKTPSAFEEKSAKPISTVKGDIIGEVVANNIGTKKLTSDQRQIKSIGKAFGVDIEFADVTTPSGLHADGVFKDGKVIIDYNTKDPVRYVVEHELTHFTENNENYGDFVKTAKNSMVYENWVKGYVFLDSELGELASNTNSVPKLSGLIREDIINHYANNGVELSPEFAERELFAKFCGECFFTDAENQQEALKSLLEAAQTQEQRNSITQFFKDLIEWFKAKLGGNHNITLELVKLQNEWARLIKQSAELTVNEKTATESDGVRYSISENAENDTEKMLFDDDFYELFKNEDKTEITETIEQLEKQLDNENLDWDTEFSVRTKIKALKAGYKSQYDYFVGREKENILKSYKHDPKPFEEKLRKKQIQAEKANKIQREISEADPHKRAQYNIIQKNNPMFDDEHVGIRSPKDIKTFAECIDDGEGFDWGDFSKEDAQKALKRGTIRIFSSYPIKNGVFVSTSYQQALDYAGGEPSNVHSRVAALESVAWINGDEGQYAKVNKTDLAFSEEGAFSIPSETDSDIEALKSEYNKMQSKHSRLNDKKQEFTKAKEHTDFMELLKDKSISDEDIMIAIEKYTQWEKTSGLSDIVSELEEISGNLKELNSRIRDVEENQRKEFMKSIESFSDEDVKKYVSKAVRKFHTTYNYKNASYLLTTGSMLDFSDGQGQRVKDHREISEILDFLPDIAGYSDGMIAFMNMGNIRLQTFGIDISSMPNTKQIDSLRGLINSLNGEFSVDFSKKDGNSNGSIDYPKGTASSKIINDIKEYFNNGTIPVINNSLNQFRYSIPAKTDSEGNKLTKEQQEFFKESKVRDDDGNLQKVYHGTYEDFTVFNIDKTASENAFGKGHYFTSSKADAEYNYASSNGGDVKTKIEGLAILYFEEMGHDDNDQYDNEYVDDYNDAYDRAEDFYKSGKVIETYLNIINPLYADEYGNLKDINGNKVSFNSSELAIKKGYDGIIDRYVSQRYKNVESGTVHYIILDSNQAKLTANLNPTSNPDIRYSIPVDQAELKRKLDSGEITEEEYQKDTQENWKAAVDKYGAFDTESEVQTPKSVDGEKSVTRVVNNILNHAALTEEQFDTLEVETLTNEMSHEVFGDKKAVKKAEDAYKKGIAVEKWDKARTASKHVSKDDIAIGVLLLKKTIEDKNTVRFMEVASELSEVATRAGQLVQAYSLIGKMNGIGKLMTLQKMVDKMNNELDKKFNGKFEPIKIDETLAGQIAKSKLGEDITSIVEDVKQDIANQVPVTFLDKWNAWRYMAMLTNPKTHIRNVVGNAIFTPFVRSKDLISASIEKVFVSKENQTKSIIIKKEYLNFAEKDRSSEMVKSAFDNGGKYNDATDIQQMRKIFKTALAEWVRETNSNLLEAEDLFFKNRHYVHALAGYLQARKADLNNIDAELLEKARIYAINEAMKATFNDANALSSWLNAAARQGIAADVFMGGLLPFKKTPINIVRRGIEYSPIGLLTTLTKGIYDLKSEKINTSEFIDGLGAGISGTVPALIGMLLVSLGWATGSFGDDKEEKFKILNGEQEYSLQILGKSYTVDWAAPACIPFFIGVEVMNAYDGKFTFANLVDASMASFDPIINLSCLSGIQNTLNSVRYEENDRVLFAIGNSVLSSYFGQAFPSAFGAVARTMDDTRRTTYVDKNSNVPETIQRVAQTSQAKIPFLENQKAAMIDNWGRRVSNGTVTERVLENFVSPGYYSKIEYDKVNKELARLSKETGSEVLPPRSQHYIRFDNKRIDFTADEYEKFATERGTKSFEIVEEIINNKLYSKMSDSQKADAIKEAYDYAFEYAKTQVSDFEMKSSFQKISSFSQSKIANYFIAKARV